MRYITELSQDDTDKFYSHVNKEPGGCWIWTGPISKGNGVLGIWCDGGWHTVMARQLSFFLHSGRLATNKLVTSCNNPLCVAPEHIHEGRVKYDSSAIDHVSKDCHCSGKRCGICREILCKMKFGNRSRTTDGLMNECFDCTYDYQKSHRNNISIEEFRIIKKKSGGKCAICGNETDDLDLDHDHLTGQVRDMLCPGCNYRIWVLEGKSPSPRKGLRHWDIEPYKRYLKKHSGPFDLVEATSLLGEWTYPHKESEVSK